MLFHGIRMYCGETDTVPGENVSPLPEAGEYYRKEIRRSKEDSGGVFLMGDSGKCVFFRETIAKPFYFCYTIVIRYLCRFTLFSTFVERTFWQFALRLQSSCNCRSQARSYAICIW